MKKIFFLLGIIMTLSITACNEKEEAQNIVKEVEQTPVVSSGTNNSETIELDSELGHKVEEVLGKIWVSPDVFNDCIAEFTDVSNADKKYLAACASQEAHIRSTTESAGVHFDLFEKILVEIFGEKAKGLLTPSDLESVFYVEKIGDDSYIFNGYDGSEVSATFYRIKSINRENNIVSVELYEYKTEADGRMIDFDLDDSISEINENVYNLNNELITTVKYRRDENGYINCYDKDNNLIESLTDYILTKFEKKVSVRTINMEYNSENESLIMLNNKLER